MSDEGMPAAAKPALFSIVIPVYNYAGVVARAIDSACGQPGDDYDVIAIDDGSTDDSAAVLARCAERWPGRLRVLRQHNRGLAAVRNRGIDESAGEYLIFLDADDELVADALARLRAVLGADRPAMIIGAHCAIDERGREKLHRQRPLPAARRDCFLGYIRKRFGISNGAVAMRRSVFEGIRYNEALRHAEDIPVFAQVLALYDCLAIAAPLARIYKHAGSMRRDVAAAKRTNLQLLEELFDRGALPAELRRYRSEFAARRCLSLFRTCYRAGDYAAALAFYRTAFGYSPLLAGAPKYLLKGLRALWRRSLR
jgi:glycosyltransferase involved in cell wall biosynthesis